MCEVCAKSVIYDVITYYPSAAYKVKTDRTYTDTRKYYSFIGAVVAMRENDVITWLLQDQVNSTTITADANGNFLSETRYSAFGEIRYANGAAVTDKLYTGQQQEVEIGLSYYIARFYDPVIAHFIQPDSLIPQASASASYDRYGYVVYNPINKNDPTGHCFSGAVVDTVFCGIMAVGAIGGGVYSYVSQKNGVGSVDPEKVAYDALTGAVIAGGVTIVSVALAAGITALIPVAGVAACADGDCTNEASILLNSSKPVYDNFVKQGFRFSQNTASPNFSNEGSFAGETIGSLSNKLSTGIVNAEKVTVGYVERAGVKLIENTLSAIALLRSGIPLEKWNLINRTGNELVESKLTARLLVNGLSSLGTTFLRITGLGKNISSLK